MSGQHWLVRQKQLGGHVHVDIWCGTASQAEQQARPKLGSLVLSSEQWETFEYAMGEIGRLPGLSGDPMVPVLSLVYGDGAEFHVSAGGVPEPGTGETPATDIHDGQDPDPIPDTTPEFGEVVELVRHHEPFLAGHRVVVEGFNPAAGTVSVAGVVRRVVDVDPRDLKPVMTQEAED